MIRDKSASDLEEINEPKCPEKALIETREKAEGNKVNSQILEDKSHEIRTYMTRIISMTDLTLMTELTDEQRDYLTIVKSSTRALLKVLNDIVDNSKVQAKKVDLEQTEFDIGKLIHDVLELFEVAAKQKNVHMRLSHLDREIPKILCGESKRLKQVLLNLVGYSVRSTKPGGEVILTVDLERLEDIRVQLKFMVSHTGGFVEEFGGSELAVSKQLLDLMGGEMHVDSQEGAGGKFYFTAVFNMQSEGGQLSSKQ